MKIHKSLLGQTFFDLEVVEYLGKNDKGRHYYRCKCLCGNFKDVSANCLMGEDTKSCGKCKHSTMPRDLKGQRFGMLVVLEKAPNMSSNKTAWHVKCDCGSFNIVKTNNLVSGHAKSCGCQVNYNKVQLIGKRFGRLLVQEIVGVQNHQRCYIAKCDCGEEVIVQGINLTRGATKSCGCLQKELAAKRASLRVGELNPSWRGGDTLNDIRKTKEYKRWKKNVLRRSKRCCRICGDSNRIEAHHLYAIAKYPDKALDVDNGICLCETCHKLFHIEYGSGDNTPQQFLIFAQNLGLDIKLP